MAYVYVCEWVNKEVIVKSFGVTVTVLERHYVSAVHSPFSMWQLQEVQERTNRNAVQSLRLKIQAEKEVSVANREQKT